MSDPDGAGPTRRKALSGAVALLAGAAVTAVKAASSPVEARDYASRLAALDEMDRLAAICGMRLGMLRVARPNAAVLVSRFLTALGEHRSRREDIRRHFGLRAGADPESQVGEVEGDLPGLKQALDELMVAYAESLPVFGEAAVVSGLAIDMVDVSKRRTVIDLWAESEQA